MPWDAAPHPQSPTTHSLTHPPTNPAHQTPARGRAVPKSSRSTIHHLGGISRAVIAQLVARKYHNAKVVRSILTHRISLWCIRQQGGQAGKQQGEAAVAHFISICSSGRTTSVLNSEWQGHGQGLLWRAAGGCFEGRTSSDVLSGVFSQASLEHNTKPPPPSCPRQ